MHACACDKNDMPHMSEDTVSNQDESQDEIFRPLSKEQLIIINCKK